MEANKGEAERCLREAQKWQRQNRPVKAFKFATKSHRLFPTQAAQQKIGELTDLLQQRGYSFPQSNNNNNNSGPSSRRNAEPSQPPLPNHHNNNNINASFSANNNHHNHNSVPHNQEFVEINPNAFNNNNRPNTAHSMLNNMLSLQFWTILLETVFGQLFASIHALLSPILPTVLLNFNLRFRSKVWWLLLTLIVLLTARYLVIGHPFGAQTVDTRFPDHTHAYNKGAQPGDNGHSYVDPDEKVKYKSNAEREFERKYNRHSNVKYNRNNNQKRNRNENSKFNGRRYEDRHRDGGYGAHYSGPRGGRYGQSGNGYSSHSYGYSSGGLFSGYNIIMMLVFGSVIMGMFRRNRNGENGDNNNGVNWNMLAFLPMLFGGFPMGGVFGRFGRRRGMFGRRRRYF